MKLRWPAYLGLACLASKACAVATSSPSPAQRSANPSRPAASAPVAKPSPSPTPASEAVQASPEATGPLRLKVVSSEPAALTVSTRLGPEVDGIRQVLGPSITPSPPDWKLQLAVPPGSPGLRLVGGVITYAHRTQASGDTWLLGPTDPVSFPPLELKPGNQRQAGPTQSLVLPLAVQALSLLVTGPEASRPVAYEYRLTLKAQGQAEELLGADGAPLTLVLPVQLSLPAP